MKNIQDCLPDDFVFDTLVTFFISELKELIESNANNDMERISQRKFLISKLVSMKVKTIENDLDELINILKIQKEDYYIKENILTGFFLAVLDLVVKKTKSVKNANVLIKGPFEHLIKVEPMEPVETNSYPFNLQNGFEVNPCNCEQTIDTKHATSSKNTFINVWQGQPASSETTNNSLIYDPSNGHLNILPVILCNKQTFETDDFLKKCNENEYNKAKKKKDDDKELIDFTLNSILKSKKKSEKTKKTKKTSLIKKTAKISFKGRKGQF
jgi:hypothetical protein